MALVQLHGYGLAVESLVADRPRRIAAIGTASAARHYKVPVLRKNIHNKPNYTLFFVIRKDAENLDRADHILLSCPNATVSDKNEIDTQVTESGCSISANWELKYGSKKSAYFVEVDGQYSTLGLYSSIKNIQSRIPKTFVVGGYQEKCITRLLWAPEKLQQKPKEAV